MACAACTQASPRRMCSPTAGRRIPAAASAFRRFACRPPPASTTHLRRDETCPVSTEGGTRRVQLGREEGGRGASTTHPSMCALHQKSPWCSHGSKGASPPATLAVSTWRRASAGNGGASGPSGHAVGFRK